MNEITLGPCRLILGDCLDVLPTLAAVDAVITDPPYGKRTHAGHDAIAGIPSDGTARKSLGYQFLSEEDCGRLAILFAEKSTGWIAWMTCSDLAKPIRAHLESAGRYAFAPLPFFHPGSTVRLTGDGPSSWTTWIVVARTKAQKKWGTLPGGYVAQVGWDDKVHMGGKPSRLMQCLVRDYSREGATVLDPFMGSGTTGIACIRTGRKFIGIEKDPVHFKTACERIERELQQLTLAI